MPWEIKKRVEIAEVDIANSNVRKKQEFRRDQQKGVDIGELSI